ncbi:hypothetical protein Ade02nite_31480 [Paractinoplanes deccanensis]|uniref:DUF982 domain-containing protein n=1 Tax=Paractinoplanes deccanensis TaxID=113561 RepID=A0ABQ3Y3D7_9ACTN|nr:hypothetical protein [Actinoplanes deccanensis]GID74507.1 hypothetical protein Ade02nite_31480 [Actinoplanes deccanensis]
MTPSFTVGPISHPTNEINGEAMEEALRFWNEGPAATMVLRCAALRCAEQVRGSSAGSR